MLRELMVKQHVGVVTGLSAWGTVTRHRVFETGDPKYYLFCLLDPNGCDAGLHHSVRKTDLKTNVRRALRHGCSFTSAAANEKLSKLTSDEVDAITGVQIAP